MIELFDVELRKRPMAVVGLFLLLIAVIRLGLFQKSFYNKAPCDEENITVTGTVYKIEDKTNSTAVYVKTENKYRIIVYVNSGTSFIDDNILSDTKYTEKSGKDCSYGFRTGNLITVTGDYASFKSPGNPGQFNMKQYYAVQKIHGSMFALSVTIQDDSFRIIPELIRTVRNYLKNVIGKIYAEPYAGIISAMLIGDKSSLDEEIRDLYSSCGIAHIIAISGLHISFFADIIKKLLRKIMGFIPGTVASMAILLVYIIIAGASASAVRAYLFFAIMMTGELLGRGSDSPTACFLSIGLMLTFKPEYLLDSGFILSYAAISGVVVLSRLILRNDPRAKLSQISTIKLGILMQLATLPLLLYFYYTYCPYGFFLNLLVIPAMPVVLGSGALSIFFGCFPGHMLPVLGKICAIPSVIILKGYEYICKITSGLPYGTIIPGKPEIWKILIYYIILFVLLAEYRLRTHPDLNRQVTCADRLIRKYGLLEIRVHKYKYMRILVQTLLCVLAITVLMFKKSPDFRLSFLDVGQGDCIYFESEFGNSYICDCGSSSESSIGKYVLVPYLKSQGIQQIDAVFITHGDSDHYNGIQELLENDNCYGIRISNLILTKQLSETDTGKKLIDLAHDRGINTFSMNAGDVIGDTGLSITCLYPESDYEISGDENDSSMVLELTYGNFRGILCGDMESTGEEVLLENLTAVNNMKYDFEQDYVVIKIGHHGSSGSTTDEFLNYFDPVSAVISYGLNNRYGHPHKETIEKLEAKDIQIYRTAVNGEVSYVINNDKLKITTFISL